MRARTTTTAMMAPAMAPVWDVLVAALLDALAIAAALDDECAAEEEWDELLWDEAALEAGVCGMSKPDQLQRYQTY